MDHAELLAKFITLEQALKGLVDLGFKPSIYWTGAGWRAHANVGGNDWAEGENPLSVLLSAVVSAQPVNRPRG